MNKISLTLKGYCIETVARLELAHLIREAIELYRSTREDRILTGVYYKH